MKRMALLFLVLFLGCSDDDNPTGSGSTPPPADQRIETYFRVLQNAGDQLLYCDMSNANQVCIERFGYEGAVKRGCVEEWNGRGNTGDGWLYSVVCWKKK